MKWEKCFLTDEQNCRQAYGSFFFFSIFQILFKINRFQASDDARLYVVRSRTKYTFYVVAEKGSSLVNASESERY